MEKVNSNRCENLVTCENCQYSDILCIFYDANKYCVECLCDHASCPECGFRYHKITIV